MHADEPDTDTSLVHRLVAAQFPRWAGLAVKPVDSHGTSHVMYRLGERMVVRLPRTAGAAEDIERECTWLPRLAPSLPVPVPVPLGRGEPGDGYPFPWAVYRWLDGEVPAAGRIPDPGRLARDLGGFVTALRRIDPAGGPASYRSETLAARDAATRTAIAGLRIPADADAEPAALTAAWEAALRAPEWPGPPVWIHADLQPGNLLLSGDRLGAVIDFGCMGLGDPAVDLLPAWYVLPAGARDAFRAAATVDDAAWARGRGWALSVALLELNYYRDTNPSMTATARRVVHEVLAAPRQGTRPTPDRPWPGGSGR
ncbi:aminoglycoside phosphotransferase family protein [Streptomyces sp. BR123]|uniref:aminoglycoside phosphotransferase family protein n=1 Tax=Streptomyces sp. BR123 TaxID=2749828 RepID=UPI0015C481E1|nr:aminoglycoside phosphotransferase family protein [Streptomyces sp. BR123]NXY95388.1 aminoglycoside phosphotransferase family protein [Streptomyces sp. BR123]